MQDIFEEEKQRLIRHKGVVVREDYSTLGL